LLDNALIPVATLDGLGGVVTITCAGLILLADPPVTPVGLATWTGTVTSDRISIVLID
jgi:hypothetical protein